MIIHPRDMYVAEQGRITPLSASGEGDRCAGNFRSKLQQY